MTETVMILVFVGVFAFPVVLYILIERETSDPTIVDRSEAERLARKQGGRRSGRHRGTDDESETAEE